MVGRIVVTQLRVGSGSLLCVALERLQFRRSLGTCSTLLHVGYVHQLHKREPCGFSTFFNISMATNVNAHDVRVTSRTNFQ